MVEVLLAVDPDPARVLPSDFRDHFIIHLDHPSDIVLGMVFVTSDFELSSNAIFLVMGIE